MATGGEDVTLSSMHDKRKSLTCAMCLDVFRNPKLLFCSHTFCQRCLEDLIQRHTDCSFPCPSCRRDIEVPAGGASAFQTNFYIDEDELERARDDTFCPNHRQKKLDTFCVDCDVLICMDCKLAAHLHHKSQSLEEAAEIARGQLSKDKARLAQAVADVGKTLVQRKADQQELREKKSVVEREIRQRHSTTVSAANEYRDEALDVLDSTFADLENTQRKVLGDVKKHFDHLQKLCRMIDHAESTGEGCKLVTVAKEMKSGHGSEHAVKALTTVPHLTEVTRPVHRSVMREDGTVFDSMKNLIGNAEYVEVMFTEAEVTAVEQFRCDSHDDITVFCVYCRTDGDVNVSFDPFFRQQKPPAKRYSEKGLFIRELTTKGNVTVGKVSCQENDGTVILFEHEHTNYAKSKPSGLVFSLSSYETESQFSTEIVVSRDPYRAKAKKLFSISCGYHRGFDVHSSQDLFAVVAEAKPPDVNRKVLLYKRPASNHGAVDAVDTYTSPLTPFQPADVCFLTLQEQEVLLIADECNDVIHVVDVQDDRLTFSRFLAPGCPLLLQPTALNTDHRGRLWVGCRGGRLLTFEPLSTAAATYSAQHWPQGASLGGL